METQLRTRETTMKDASSPPRRKDASPSQDSAPSPCPRCAGTGMACRHVPEVGPSNCCVDFANDLCPLCGGSGKAPGPEAATS